MVGDFRIWPSSLATATVSQGHTLHWGQILLGVWAGLVVANVLYLEKSPILIGSTIMSPFMYTVGYTIMVFLMQ